MDYGKAIKIRRAELSLSQQDVADKVGVKKQTISQYETGKVKSPDYRMLRDIFQFLELDFTPYKKYLPNASNARHEPASTSSAPLDSTVEYLKEKLAQVEKEKQDLLSKYISLLEKLSETKTGS